MSIRLTEEEAKALGYVKDSKGNWTTSVQRSYSREVPKPESSSRIEGESKVAAAKEHDRSSSKRYRIEVTARCRKRTDPDNLCPKWFIDRLVVFGIIPDDSCEVVEEVVKRIVKVENWEPETTTIEVWELDS